jgi:hypothetical protein
MRDQTIARHWGVAAFQADIPMLFKAIMQATVRASCIPQGNATLTFNLLLD